MTARIRSFVAHALFLCAFVAAVDYAVFWLPFRASLREGPRTELEPPRHVDEATMLRVGSLRADRSSSFSRFDPDKPAGKVRVCAFGDSFTYGDETADGHDYPALLADLFAERGVANVEVLNFGNSWHGFHQTYFLWDGVGRRFGCDFVLLGPDGFQPERDTTLNHTGLAFPYYLHARFVLDGSDLRPVEVPGRTPDERFDAYFGFFPDADVLRYDRAAPAFLRAVVRPPRELANPFYYYDGPAEEEAYATYDRLLRRLANSGVQVLVLHSRPDVIRMVEDIGAPHVVGVLAPRNERFPYAAPGGHYSAFGNRWIAEQFLALLSHGERLPTLLELERLPRSRAGEGAARTSGSASPLRIEACEAIELRLAGRAAGLLAVASPDPAERRGAPSDLHRSGVVSLLAVGAPGAALVDAAIVPVRAALRDGDALVLRSTAAGGDAVEVPLGQVRVLDPSVAFAAADVEGIELEGELRLYPAGRLAAQSFDPQAPVELVAGGAVVLRSTGAGPPWRLAPPSGSVRHFRAGPGQYVGIERLAANGVATLAFRAGDLAVEVPIAAWRMRRSQPFAADRTLARRLDVTGATAALREKPALLDAGSVRPANWAGSLPGNAGF